MPRPLTPVAGTPDCPSMSRFGTTSAIGWLTCALVLAACDRPQQAPPPDTVVASVPDTLVDTVALPPRTTWDSDAGPALFVHLPGTANASALVILPDVTGDAQADTTTFDSSVLRNVSVEMFARSGRVGQGPVAQIAERTDGSACMLWPTAMMRDVAGTWSVGFQSGRAQALPADSIETMASQDSARLAADVTRLASALPSDTAAALRGIPFGVRTAYRFSPVPGVTAVAAHVTRKLTIEASPMEEHILLVAETDSGDTRFRVAYFERTSGPEETVETMDVLAGVLLGPSRRPTLIVERIGESARAFSLLERVGARSWRVRWTSAYSGC